MYTCIKRKRTWNSIGKMFSCDIYCTHAVFLQRIKWWRHPRASVAPSPPSKHSKNKQPCSVYSPLTIEQILTIPLLSFSADQLFNISHRTFEWRWGRGLIFCLFVWGVQFLIGKASTWGNNGSHSNGAK